METDHEVEDGDLLAEVGDEAANQLNYSRYWEWENDIATPILVAKGWQVGRFWSGDKDSFGPLVRCVKLTKNGNSTTYSYG